MQKDPITRRDRPNTCRKKSLNSLGKAIEACFQRGFMMNLLKHWLKPLFNICRILAI